ncbi:MAG: hypothetical protein P5702_17755 [Limnospira sp. PMC 1291.21]|uniref:Uncharacterized protein n=3 Tax=Limnospira TaxID=2596745 RepID=A0A9P1P040_9CYAN|nr:MULTISPECIES: hypothetical protein [Limnospira]EKD11672.1 hypothetical protein SPLC1_S010690 [Arthrospira platensis C1]MDC0837574.1 hypothetical protein [Limnoraphis robusta]MDY7055445.1 hypothetical protein [Limnospira fusiformis LS22]QJB27265.1 hypothetical protein HFV01_17635 [Limnospira fusiformis SAG 85.79]RAQ40499.1 hypothetical protein B9S53_15525 [Arthrospira sp. O9.13F]
MEKLKKYRINCTLTYGDIYGQIMIWLIVIFIALASSLALWSSSQQIFALTMLGLIVVLSLPFLLFAFVTTLLNHIEVMPTDINSETATDQEIKGSEQPAQATS